MKVVDYEYVEINNISCIFSDMAAKMAAKNYNLMYLSSPFKKIQRQINTQSASLRSLVAAESKAAEIKAAVACFESVCQLLTGICLECLCQL